MDIKKYIASGILEHYVLGLASEEERKEVEMYASAYPEIKAELEAVEVAMEQYAELQGIDTPPGINAKINSQIDTLQKGKPKNPGTNDASTFGGWGMILLLGGMLLATGWWAFSNSQKAAEQEETISTLTTEFETLQTDCDQTSKENEALKDKIKILQNPDNQVIKLGEAQDKYTNVLASVFYNKATQKSYLRPNALPDIPSDRVLQLWAIVDGTPTDMGLVEVTADSDDLIEIPFIENAAAFAITVETGRNAAPNLEELVVIGNVAS
ncbi:MAG: anti-sigma factor [Saprospiraceae bacterium]